LKPDQAPSAILELVDGPKDMRFAMTARTIARERADGVEPSKMTERNIEKVTTFRKGGEQALEIMVEKLSKLEMYNRDDKDKVEKRWGGNV
jgi:large subunit ribosomal protein L17